MAKNRERPWSESKNKQHKLISSVSKINLISLRNWKKTIPFAYVRDIREFLLRLCHIDRISVNARHVHSGELCYILLLFRNLSQFFLHFQAPSSSPPKERHFSHLMIFVAVEKCENYFLRSGSNMVLVKSYLEVFASAPVGGIFMNYWEGRRRTVDCFRLVNTTWHVSTCHSFMPRIGIH